ncbi:MAG: peroxidase-related enzyme, partial [Planctomycetota bacterium]
TDPMTHIQPVDQASAPAASQPLLDAVQKKMGMVPNLLGTLAQAPAALRSYLDLSGAVATGNLSAADRERVALAVGQANSCDYCLAAHTMLGKGAGLSEEETLLARQGSGATPRDAALARFAVQVTESRGNLTPGDLDAFRGAGFGDGDVLEVIALVALNTLTSYTNHIARTAIDFPAAPVLQPA